MPHLTIMGLRSLVLVVAFTTAVLSTVGTVALAPQAEAIALRQSNEQVPPGNPVIGSDRPGDLEPENDTRYGLWVVVAVCLIGAGTLLVKVERWESRRQET